MTNSKFVSSCNRLVGSANLQIHNHYHLNTNEAFTRHLKIDLTKDIIEMPIWYKRAIAEAVLNGYSECVVNLAYTTDDHVYRTFDTIWNRMSAHTHENSLIKIKTPNDVYYGSHGIILNRDFTPLCMLYVKCIKDAEQNSLSYTGLGIKVHPSVFMFPKDIINKGIISKIIPYYSKTGTISFCSLFSFLRYPQSYCMHISPIKEIDISDFSDMKLKTNKPLLCGDVQESLNKCLNDNIEEVLRDTW